MAATSKFRRQKARRGSFFKNTANSSEKCRLCLGFSDRDNDDGEIYHKIKLCLGLIIIPMEGQLPHRICEECVRKIDDFYSYRVSCWDVRAKLLEIRQEKSSSNKVPYDPIDISSCSFEEKVLSLLEITMGSSSETDSIHHDDPLPMYHERENSEVSSYEWESKQSMTDLAMVQSKQMDTYGKINKAQKKQDSIKLCEICGKKICTTFLEGHQNMHYGLKPFVCGVHECTNAFSCKHARRSHIKLYHSQETYLCPECSKECNSKSQLSTHRLHQHTQGKPFGCHICGKFFKVKGSLKKHLWTHSGEKRATCSYCSKEFATARSAKLHELIHTDEKPYQCSHCKDTFRYYQQWKRHLRAKHTDAVSQSSDREDAKQSRVKN